MNPGHLRHPQIIRLLAGAALGALLLPTGAAAQVPCVSCLVIGVDAADLASAPAGPGALEGVQLLVTGAPRADILVSSGATAAVLVTPASDASVAEIVFAARTAITALR